LVSKEHELELKISEINNKYQNQNNQVVQHENNINNLDIERSNLLKEIRECTLAIHLLSESLWVKQRPVIDNMASMKLPKEISEQFFIDLIEEDTCVCGEKMTDNKKLYIKNNYKYYLDENDIGILNQIRKSANDHTYNKQLIDLIDNYNNKSSIRDVEETKLRRLKKELDREQYAKLTNFREELKKIRDDISKKNFEISGIESTDVHAIKIGRLTSKNNLFACERKIEELEKTIEAYHYNKRVKKNYYVLKALIDELKKQMLSSIKNMLEENINTELSDVHTFDQLKILIDDNIKVYGKSGVSTGESLSIAYIFISTLFNSSFYNLPLIIDSPVNSLDNNTRNSIARILPEYFEQLILFITSSERNHFVSEFTKHCDEKISYYTIYKEDINSKMEVNETYNFFMNYDS